MARFDLHAIPVVDDEHHMLGIITHDDVIDVVRQEATEDVHRWVPSGQGRRRITWKTSSAPSGGSEPSGCRACSSPKCFTLRPKLFQAGGRRRPGPDVFRPALHFDRRQLRLASRDADHPRDGLGAGGRLSDWWRVLWHELAMGLALGCSLAAIGFVRG